MNTPNFGIMQVINLAQKLTLFSDYWHPRIVGALNGQHVKVAKIKGDFIWHSHADADELFWVLEGTMLMEFRDRTVRVGPGEMIIVPRGVEHRPRAEEEVHLLLFEPAGTRNTGDADSALTREDLEWV